MRTRTSSSVSRASAWLLSALAFAAFLTARPPVAGAAETAKFVVTLKKVELKNNTGQWITVIEPDRRIDLVNEEASVSFFNNGGRVPPGNYINYRITLSETVSFVGRDKANHSREGGRSTVGGPAATAADLPGEITVFREDVPTWTQDAMGEVTQKLDFDGQDKDDVITIVGKRDFTTPFEVKKGSFIRVWFSVNVEDAVRYAWPGAFGEHPKGDAMVAFPPKQVDELSVTVDERTEECSPETVLVEL